MDKENDVKNKYYNDSRTTQELIELALREDDRHARRELIKVLQYRGSYEVFEAARELCESTVEKEKILGANILARFGVPKRTFLEESLPILFNLLSEEQDDDVLCSVIRALGNLADERIVEHVVKLKKHPSEFVRSSIVTALGGQHKQEAIDALIELSNDEDDDIRNWATFDLGSQIDTDTPEIREALFQRINERGNWVHDATRKAAIFGLARRKDIRAIEPLMKELELLKEFKDTTGLRLEDGSLLFITIEDEGFLLMEAAKELADPRLLLALLQLKDLWSKDNSDLESAIVACQSKTL